MGWQPPERPDWVRAINEGQAGPIVEEARRPLARDALIGEACARQGRTADDARARAEQLGRPGFEAEPVIENLDRLLAALEEEARLSLVGRWLMRRFLLRLLEVRLQILAFLDADPGVREEPIERPLFVAGAPRTGTTVLHTMLAADPRHRVPEGWELLRPVPPPSPDPDRFAADPRIAIADRELVRPQTVVQGLLAIHEYGGRKPKECLSAMSFAFQSEEFTARCAIPGYAEWLEGSDMTPAYAMHRLVLQILQRGRAPSAWVLKSPVHLHALPTLFATYPDARVAITHRDPLTLLGSLTSLIATLRWAHSDAVDPDAIGEEHLRRYRRSFERLVDWSDTGAIPNDRVHHSRFQDFRDRPLETVSELYARFDLGWDEAVAQALRAALAGHPSDRHGEHVYARPAAGDARRTESLRADFARYQKRFEVPSDD